MSGANGTYLYYDAAGRLDQVTQSGFGWQWDGSRLVAERSAGGIARRYVLGAGVDEPVVWYEGAGTGQRRWLDADERGSIVRVTDDAGGVVALNSYDEYGIPGPNNQGRFQYTGQMWMPELGIYHYKARMYSPTLGRFLQTDPIGYADGLNLYAYVGGDPVNMTDPSGLDGCSGNDFMSGDGGTCNIRGRRPPVPYACSHLSLLVLVARWRRLRPCLARRRRWRRPYLARRRGRRKRTSLARRQHPKPARTRAAKALRDKVWPCVGRLGRSIGGSWRHRGRCGGSGQLVCDGVS